MKKITLYIIILLLALTKVASSQTATIQSVNGTIGSMQVNVNLANFTGSNALGAITMKIGFDPTIASFTGLSSGAINASEIYVNITGNEIQLSWSKIPAVAVNGIGFILNFDYTGGSCVLSCNQGCEMATGMGIPIQTTFLNGAIVQPVLSTSATIGNQPGAYSVVNELPVVFSGFPTIPANNLAGAVSLHISYNSSKLQFIDITGLSGATANASGGVINIAWSSSTPVNLNLINLKLRFNYLGGASAVIFTGTNTISNASGVQIPVNFVNGGISQPVTSALVDIGDALGNLAGTTTVPVTFASFPENQGALTLNIAYNSSVLNFNGTSGLAGLVANASNGIINLTWYNNAGLNITVFNLLFTYIGGVGNIEFTGQNAINNISGNPIPVTFTNGTVTQAPTPVNVILGNTPLTVGSNEVLVPLNLIGITGNVFATTMYVNFDISKLTFMQAVNATPGVIANIDFATNTIVITWQNATTSLGNGKLLDLKFTFTGGPGNYDVPVFFTTFNGNASSLMNALGNTVLANWIDGKVNPFPVSPSSFNVSGYVFYDENPAKPLKDVSIDILLVSDNSVYTTVTSDVNGYYEFTAPNGSYIINPSSTKPWGGAAGSDKSILKNYLNAVPAAISIATATPARMAAADVNNKGGVSGVDVSMLSGRLNTSDPNFSFNTTGTIAPDWRFQKPTIIINSANVSQNLWGICAGDINGSH